MKALNIASFIVDYSFKKKYRMNSLRLQMLLYFLYVIFYLSYKEELFEEEFVIGENRGPVITEVFEHFKNFNTERLSQETAIKEERNKIMKYEVFFEENIKFLNLFEEIDLLYSVLQCKIINDLKIGDKVSKETIKKYYRNEKIQLFVIEQKINN